MCGLKNVDIKSKIKSLQCSWVKKLYDDNFHEWKIIPLYLIEKTFGKTFKFHSNLSFNRSNLLSFPDCYKEMFLTWKNTFSHISDISSCIKSQFLWFNDFLKIENETFHFKEFSENNINFIYHLFKDDGVLKPWIELKQEFSLNNNLFFKWVQLCDSVPKNWKAILKASSESSDNLIYMDHHLIKQNRLLCLQKLDSKELYSIATLHNSTVPTSQKYFDSIFSESSLDWNLIYVLPRLTTKDTQLRAFQYKILHNILYLNKKLFQFGNSESPMCSFCKRYGETPFHIFCSCIHVVETWSQLGNYFSDCITLPQLNPQTAILGYTNSNEQNFLLQNHILLAFKKFIYASRNSGNLILSAFLKKLSKIRNTEKAIASNDKTKLKRYNFKWLKVEYKLKR